MKLLSEDVWCTIVLFLDIFDVSAAALASPNFLITNRVRRVAINCQTERKIVASRAQFDTQIMLHTVRSPTSWLTRVILANNLSFTVWGGMRSGTVNDQGRSVARMLGFDVVDYSAGAFAGVV